MNLPKLEKIEVTKSQFIAIKRAFNKYVFNRSENGRYFVQLSKKMKRECVEYNILPK